MTDEQSMFDLLIEKTKKHLKKHPNTNVADFSNGYLFPILEQMMEMINDLGEDVDTLFENTDVPEKSLIAETSTTLLDLVGFIDIVLVRSGWLSASGPTDAFPPDLRQRFVALQGAVATTVERLREASDADDGDEIDDEEQYEASSEQSEEVPPAAVISEQAAAATEQTTANQ
jgi:hypothetical protein